MLADLDRKASGLSAIAFLECSSNRSLFTHPSHFSVYTYGFGPTRAVSLRHSGLRVLPHRPDRGSPLPGNVGRRVFPRLFLSLMARLMFSGPINGEQEIDRSI